MSRPPLGWFRCVWTELPRVALLARVDDIEGSRRASGLDDAFALVAGWFFGVRCGSAPAPAWWGCCRAGAEDRLVAGRARRARRNLALAGEVLAKNLPNGCDPRWVIRAGDDHAVGAGGRHCPRR
jgi:hypothetical protein